jgi:hypothetical protein
MIDIRIGKWALRGSTKWNIITGFLSFTIGGVTVQAGAFAMRNSYG